MKEINFEKYVKNSRTYAFWMFISWACVMFFWMIFDVMPKPGPTPLNILISFVVISFFFMIVAILFYKSKNYIALMLGSLIYTGFFLINITKYSIFGVFITTLTAVLAWNATLAIYLERRRKCSYKTGL